MARADSKIAASVPSARCVGTVNPARAAYRPAARRHADAVTSALREATATGMRSAIQRAIRNIRPFTRPTCSPEIKSFLRSHLKCEPNAFI